jgi:hypothetical protein
MIIKVNITNKATGKVKCKIRFEHIATDSAPNVNLPASAFKEVLYKTGDVKAIIHLEKKVPYMPWTPIRVIVESVEVDKPKPTASSNGEGKNLATKDFTINVIDGHFDP